MKDVIVKVAVTYDPPTFKYEYTKGPDQAKYHRVVGMADFVNLFNQHESHQTLSITDSSFKIAQFLTEKHNELNQVPLDTIQHLVGKLLSFHSQLQLQMDNAEMQEFPTNVVHNDGHINMTIQSGSLLLSPLKPSVKFQSLCTKFTNNYIASITSSNMDEDEDHNNKYKSPPTPLKIDMETISTQEKERLRGYGDLNKVTEKELEMAKEEMNCVFEKLQIVPGDEGYEYDKRREFGEPNEESSWD